MDGISLYFSIGDPQIKMNEGKRVKLWFNIALAAMVTGLFFLWAMRAMDVDETVHALRSSSLAGWLVCCGFMALVSALRFLRIQVCAPGVSSLCLYRATALHGVAISFLPGKLGEAALPIALRQLAGMSLLSGAGVLFLIRLFDLAVITTMVLIAYCAAGLIKTTLATVLFVGVLMAITGLALLPLVVRVCVRRMPRGQGFMGRIFTGLTEALALLDTRQTYGALGISVAIWGCLAAAGYASMMAMGLTATPANASLGVAFGSLAFALPVNGLASAGPFEAAFAFALGLFDLNLEASLAAAAHFHICAIVMALLAALLGQIMVVAQLSAPDRPQGDLADTEEGI